MLTNVLRLVGHVVDAKRRAGRTCNPALVLLPLSPNHGIFGGDGLVRSTYKVGLCRRRNTSASCVQYAESKLGLEALCHKWGSEGWGDYASITGAVIGWTRGTGLMADNNGALTSWHRQLCSVLIRFRHAVVSEGVEALGCRTFSQAEMAFCLTALLHPLMVRQGASPLRGAPNGKKSPLAFKRWFLCAASSAPVWADLRGGFHAVSDLKAAVASVRASIEAEAALARALAAEAVAEVRSCGVDVNALPPAAAPVAAAARGHKGPSPSASTGAPSLVAFPPLPSEARRTELAASTGLRGPAGGSAAADAEVSLLDLDSTVVVTGFGELGPWGLAATRWEAEAGGAEDGERSGRFSPAGCVLLAWLTGRIRYAPPAAGAASGCWLDAVTGEALDGVGVKARFEADLLAHAGIRVVEPGLCDGYDPARKAFFHAVALDRDQASWVEVAGEAQVRTVRAAVISVTPLVLLTHPRRPPSSSRRSGPSASTCGRPPAPPAAARGTSGCARGRRSPCRAPLRLTGGSPASSRPASTRGASASRPTSRRGSTP